MEEMVTLKLSTYDGLQMEISELQDEVGTLKNSETQMFQANKLGNSVYIELTEHSANLINNIIKSFAQTHEVKEYKQGDTVCYLHLKKEETTDGDTND